MFSLLLYLFYCFSAVSFHVLLVSFILYLCFSSRDLKVLLIFLSLSFTLNLPFLFALPFYVSLHWLYLFSFFFSFNLSFSLFHPFSHSRKCREEASSPPIHLSAFKKLNQNWIILQRSKHQRMNWLKQEWKGDWHKIKQLGTLLDELADT